MRYKPQLAIIFCLSIALAGCPMDSGQNPHSLAIHISDTTRDSGFTTNATVDLEGRPPTDAVYHEVRVLLMNDSTEIAEYELGDITTDRHSVWFNYSTESPPDKILVKYNRVSGVTQPGVIEAYRWNSQREIYERYTEYTPEY